MTIKRMVWGGVLLVGLFIAWMPAIFAHGSMQDPVSRALACFLEDPESPDSAACQEAVAVGGTQALYDWNEINIGDAAGRHRELIPDGKLCSAGRAKYVGMDLAHADWPATQLMSGAQHTFRYAATAPHRGTFELYVTRDSYDPMEPLKWSDLEATPFLQVLDPPLIDGAYVMSGQLPTKYGRHIIYSIWQRSDSPEAFYACSDVLFGADPQPTSTNVTPSVTQPPTGCTLPAWDANNIYYGGDRVSYVGYEWRAKWWTQNEQPNNNTSNVWEQLGLCQDDAPNPTPTHHHPTATPSPPTPTHVHATTTPIPSTPTHSDIEPWQHYTSYAVGAHVSYNGSTYTCRQAHTSLPGWEPTNVPALWLAN